MYLDMYPGFSNSKMTRRIVIVIAMMISTVSAEVQKSRYKLGKTKWARNQTRPCLLMPEVEVAGGHWRVCDAPPPRQHWQH